MISLLLQTEYIVYKTTWHHIATADMQMENGYRTLQTRVTWCASPGQIHVRTLENLLLLLDCGKKLNDILCWLQDESDVLTGTNSVPCLIT